MDDEIDIYMVAVAISNLADEMHVSADKVLEDLSKGVLKDNTEDVKFELESNGWL
jgi:hypothetical protein